LAGLSLLVPYLTEESPMMAYPKITQLYFDLLVELVTNYPEQFSSLAPPIHAQMLKSIRFALSHYVPKLVQAGQKAQHALTVFNDRGKRKGKIIKLPK